jgi:uracil-DNA glycosylase
MTENIDVSLSTLLPASWQPYLNDQFAQHYFIYLTATLKHISESNEFIVYPPRSLIFAAFDYTPFDSVSVVILGQDPYHDRGQAEGLAFSVPQHTKIPSSLQNIFKELKSDLGCAIPNSGSLRAWARQGVLLLNTCLTVTAHLPNSHKKLGWETFTTAVIEAINDHKTGVVFLLWGKDAQQKQRLIDREKHYVLTASHPSGLSAHKGFFGCKHFSECNTILERQGKAPINWQL